MEFLALCLICLLRYDIYKAESDKNVPLDSDGNQIVGDEGEEFFQADILWMLGFLSCFFSIFYGIYLIKKLTKDLDICDFYHEQDQKTFNKINEEFDIWKKESSKQIDGKTIKRRQRLTNFELDQLF